MEATRASETSVLTRPTRRHISENVIFRSLRSENLKSYMYQGFLQNWLKILEVSCSHQACCIQVSGTLHSLLNLLLERDHMEHRLSWPGRKHRQDRNGKNKQKKKMSVRRKTCYFAGGRRPLEFGGKREGGCGGGGGKESSWTPGRPKIFSLGLTWLAFTQKHRTGVAAHNATLACSVANRRFFVY
jgi:hypothetical protein